MLSEISQTEKRQILYDLIHMWNLKNKQKLSSWIQRTDRWLSEAEGVERGELVVQKYKFTVVRCNIQSNVYSLHCCIIQGKVKRVSSHHNNFFPLPFSFFSLLCLYEKIDVS